MSISTQSKSLPYVGRLFGASLSRAHKISLFFIYSKFIHSSLSVVLPIGVIICRRTSDCCVRLSQSTICVQTVCVCVCARLVSASCRWHRQSGMNAKRTRVRHCNCVDHSKTGCMNQMDYDRHNVINFIIIVLMAVIMITCRLRAWSEWFWLSHTRFTRTALWTAKKIQVKQCQCGWNARKRESGHEDEGVNERTSRHNSRFREFIGGMTPAECSWERGSLVHLPAARSRHVIDEIILSSWWHATAATYEICSNGEIANKMLKIPMTFLRRSKDTCNAFHV